MSYIRQPNSNMTNGQFQATQHFQQPHPRSEKLKEQLSDIIDSLTKLIDPKNQTKDQEDIEKCNNEIKKSLIQFECEIDRSIMNYSKLFLQYYSMGDKNRPGNTEPEAYLKDLAEEVDKIELD